jgi:hypothetical protein
MILYSSHQLRNRHIKSEGNDLQVAEANLFLPILQIRDEAPVNPDMLGHIDLCPATAFPQFLQPFPESDTNIIWHATYNACRL